MKVLLAGFFLFFLGCETKPFTKHELKFSRVKDDCQGMSAAFKMNSNLNGERYEFQRCLDEDFSASQLESIRQGDTVVLKFTRTPGKKQAMYDLIVDVDSYPRYNFLTIDGETFTIIPTSN